MFWMIAAVVGSVAATVGTSVYSSVAQKNASDEMVKNQKEQEVNAALVVYGQALAGAPGSIPI